MGKSKKLLLVHRAMEKISIDESVNIMLSPQFYTLKRESLPVKYAYQAKKIAPSLFEGLLDEQGTHDYAVFKEEEDWIFVAYDIENITAFLSTKGIPLEKIAKIYFAQESAKHFKTPVLLTEKEALVTLDNTVVVMPRAALGEEATFVKFDESFMPNKGGVTIKGGGSSSLLTQQQAYALATIFLLFGAMFIVEGARYGQAKADTAKLQSLYEEHPALESGYTRQGIIDKYRKIDIKERKKRDAIKHISKMIFKGSTLTSLTVNDKTFKAFFLCANATAKKQVKQLAKKSQFNTTTDKAKNSLVVEGAL